MAAPLVWPTRVASTAVKRTAVYGSLLTSVLRPCRIMRNLLQSGCKMAVELYGPQLVHSPGPQLISARAGARFRDASSCLFVAFVASYPISPSSIFAVNTTCVHAHLQVQYHVPHVCI